MPEFGDADALERLFADRRGRIAAFIAEPVQGNGGVRVPPAEYSPAGCRRLCDEHGVLVLDEVQTGFGPTGRWFACQHWGIVPDVMVLSKSLGNGFPIAAFITTDAIAGSYTRPGASTYGGNPVSAAAADRRRSHFTGNISWLRAGHELGVYLLSRVQELAGGNRHLLNPRGWA